MRVLWRVPSLSRDSFVASLADALGTGLLAGAVQPFAGTLARPPADGQFPITPPRGVSG